ncbi:MAG: response regulator [Candidatus Aminicenantes bacterium]|nr:response regulator [Candidatus Aminicenantes bacterium]
MSKKTVGVPPDLKKIFLRSQELVEKYFRKKKENPSKGTIEIEDQRYILIRAASLSAEFFDVIKKLYSDKSEKQAMALTRDLLFDVAHAIGVADAKNFHAKMNLKTPIEKLSVGPIHFAYSGWGVVHILPESHPVPNEDYLLIYDHPHSFEAQVWQATGKKMEFPVCVMNAGYSSGWCEESFGVPLIATEILCQARGADHCRFIMGHPDRIRDFVDGYVKKHPQIAKQAVTFEDTGFFKKKKFEDDLRQKELLQEKRGRKYSEQVQKAIYEISEAAQAATSLEQLCQSIHAIIGELMPARNFYIALYDRDADLLQFPYWVDEFDATPPSNHPGKGLTDYVLRTGQPLLAAPEVFERLVQSGEVASIGKPSLDWLGVPLKTQAGETIGVMTVQTYSESVRYSDTDKNVLVFVSNQVAMMIERMRADEALRQSEERHRRMVDNAPMGILTANCEGHIIDVNPVLLRILGSPSAAATKAINILTFPPLIEAGIGADFKKCMDESRLITGEYPYTSKWGKKVYLRANLVPILDIAGAVVGIMGMFEDITEHKQMEEERRNLEERLRRMEKMEAIGTLAGGVAHDLNNVLGVLSGYAELLMMETKANSPVREHAGKILKSSERGAAIIQDLLTLARRGVAVSEVTNLNQIIDDYLKSPEFMKLLSQQTNVRVETSLAADLLNVSGSSVHLSKTIMNLVLNAAEAIVDAGVITISTCNCYLDKPIKGYDEMKAGDYSVLTVSDTGSGIASQDIGRIFEPFYTKKKMGRSGTGLGLAVVWGTVKDHNGYIDVQSKEGKGSIFTLYFPITRESRCLDQTQVSLAHFMGKGESILVVDDLPEQREVAAAMLSKVGYIVKTVDSGEEALKYLSQHTADLVILDMIMDPGMDGLETFRQIQVMIPKQKAIIVSGFAETDRARKALELGAGAYIQKPFIMEKICQAIRHELDRAPRDALKDIH